MGRRTLKERIIREKDYVEYILKTGNIEPYNTYELSLIIRYKLQEGKQNTYEEIRKFIIEFLELNATDFLLPKWDDKISKLIKQEITNNKPLVQINNIPIFKKEIDVIDSLDTIREKRLLFTLIILTRYEMLKRGSDEVVRMYMDTDSIYNIANLTGVKKDDRELTMHSLIQKGLVEKNKKGSDDVTHLITCMDTEEYEVDSVMTCVTQIKDLGKKYSDYLRVRDNGWKWCTVCGKAYKPTNNSGLYCKECSIEKQREYARNHNRKIRNSTNV